VWRFLVDENLPRSLASELAARGYAAEHVYDIGLGGAKNPAVFAHAQGAARNHHYRGQGLF
jgi:predicted nuclease of predicted toxin-antitoxin system